MLMPRYQPAVVPTYPESVTPIEGEIVMLAMLLNDNRRVDTVADMLRGEDFSEPLFGRLYDRIVQIVSAGQQANPITLHPIFAADPGYIDMNGMAFLADLTGNAAHMALLIRARDQAETIAECAARRRLIDASNSLLERTADRELTLATLVDEADAALVAAIERREPSRQATLDQGIGMALDRIKLIKENDGKIGASTGLLELDQLVGGFEPGQLIIVGGRPGMGKTAVACAVALGLARNGHGVHFASMEMSSSELATRMMADLACRALGDWIPFDALIEGRTTLNQDERLSRLRAASREWPLEIDDRSAMSVARLSLAVRRTKRCMAAKGQTLKVVIIDYLQLMTSEQKGQSAYETVSAISKGLKILAKDLEVTVIALAQLSRAVEQRDDKRPQLADLRDSGQIEQDADAVLFLFREEYYLSGKAKAGNEEAHERARASAAGKLELILAKRRNGRTGRATVQYLTPYQAVRSLDWGRI